MLLYSVLVKRRIGEEPGCVPAFMQTGEIVSGGRPLPRLTLLPPVVIPPGAVVSSSPLPIWPWQAAKERTMASAPAAFANGIDAVHLLVSTCMLPYNATSGPQGSTGCGWGLCRTTSARNKGGAILP